MKIIFISHSYPPLKGGIENQNFNLVQGLKKVATVQVIANGKGKWLLPFFVPYATIKALILMSGSNVCLVGSGVLSPIAIILKFFNPNKKCFSVVHGLDITYANRRGILPKIYKFFNIYSLRRLEKLFMVGKATIEEAVKIGIDRKKCFFIPNGVDIEKLKKCSPLNVAEKLFEQNLEGKKIILRLGRFVPHKGTSWFIGQVMPKLSKNVLLIAAGGRVGKGTAGDKDDFPACQKAINDNHLESRVRLVENISDEDRNALYHSVDLVVAPNVKITGTMEGFGINVVEAAACKRIVIAANLEGLASAIQDGQNGFLVESEDTEPWIRKIEKVLESGQDFADFFGEKAKKHVQHNYSWDNIANQYLAQMK